MTWEQRWHPLREEWIIIAEHRENRPRNTEEIKHQQEELPEYVEDCYLCPGNTRSNGLLNDDYNQTYVFDNDHACVSFNAPAAEETGELYKKKNAHGIARVVCYSPKHNLTLAELSTDQIVRIFKVWQRQYAELSSHPDIKHVLIFENKGEIIGVTNPHPHCQIYATNFVYKFIESEAHVSREYYQRTGRILFQDILNEEKKDGRRILFENDNAIAFLPYFARYAYEVYVAPKKTYPSITAVPDNELIDLAAALGKILIKFDNLWKMPFPYVMSLHQAPTDENDYSSFHFHFEFHPPLLKPNLLKYLAGPEIGGGNFLSETSPEEKAAELLALPDIHYKKT